MYLCKKCLEKFLSEGERDILITQSFAKNGKCDNCKKFERGLTEVETIKEVFCEEN